MIQALAHFLSSFAPLLLEASLRALLAAVAVWAGLRLLGVGNVLVQKAAWGFVLVAALALPLLPRWHVLPASVALKLPAMGGLTQQPTQQALVTAVSETTPRIEASRYSAPIITTGQFDMEPDAAAAAPATRTTAALASETTGSLPDFGAGVKAASRTAAAQKAASRTATPHHMSTAAMAWCVYLGVFAALLLRLGVGLASALRLWLTAEAVAERVRSSARVASPVNIGSGIVLPAAYVDWDEEKLRIVLAHERSHVRQGDFYLQILAAFYAALFWFSPLGWWLKRKLYELGEAISDRAGLEQAASRSSYAQILLEFAALPRPTLTGVAMARTSHLSERIERLLNESSFRHAFAAAGRRALIAVLLVPAALLAATALVHVEAAGRSVPVQSAPSSSPTTGQSTPEQVTVQVLRAQTAAPAPQAAPQPAVMPDAAQTALPAPPSPEVMPDPHAMPAPPDSPIVISIPKIDMNPAPRIIVQIPKADFAKLGPEFVLNTFPNFPMDDGEQYALVGDPGAHVRYMGGWDGEHKAEIEKARQMAHGHFLWFRKDDKSYIVDDPAIVAQIEAMDKPMDDLNEQMRALGKQMREIGQQQREAGMQMRDANVATPDLTKEIADLNAAVATLQSKQGGTISQKELGDLQRQLGQAMGQLGALQGKLAMEQRGVGGGMGQFGKQQGELGSQMGALGKQMGQIARENHEKVEGIIKDSLANGKAKPVQ